MSQSRASGHRSSSVTLLDRLSNPERLAGVGDWIIECRTGAELLDRAGRISHLS